MQKAMRYILSLILTFAMAMSSHATLVHPYTMDFNLNIATDEHDFLVGSSWGHIVDQFNDGYTRYTYHPNGGIGGSGYLEIGSQTMIDWGSGDEHPLNDLLVTPAVTGHVSIYAMTTRQLSSTAGIKFYKMTLRNGTYTMVEEITPQTYAVQYNTFTKIELPAMPSGTYIGIRGSNVAIDNFEAEQADISQQQALTLASAVWNGGKYADCDAQGRYKVSYRVSVQNSGDVPLQPGTEGYAVHLMESGSTHIIATQQVRQALAVGETSEELTLEATIDQATYPTAHLMIEEGLTHTTLDLPTVTPSPYAAQFSLTGAYGYTPLATGNSIEYGTSRQEVSVPLMMRNTGSQPQTITEISVTPGFKASLQAPLEIAGHDSLYITLTMTPDVTGDKRGHLTLRGDGGVDIVLNLNGYTPSLAQTLYDFEDERIPEGFVTNSAWYIDDMPTYIYSINNKLCLRNDKQGGGMLALPKMKVEEGQTLRFDLSKIYPTASYVNVYYSADRHNWTLLRAITAQEMSDTPISISWTGYYYAFSPFSIDNVPAGEWYIGFEAGYAYLDNIVTDFSPVPIAHDAYFDKLKGTDMGKVNSTMQVNATLHNITAHDEPAGTYTVAYYLDDECMGEVDAQTLKALGSRDVALNIAPHTAGRLNGYWKYTAADCVVTSDTTQIMVLEETTKQETLTDPLVSHSYTSNAPMDPYNYNGESEAIYLASELGLKAGTKIQSVSWYGNNLGEDAWLNVKVYLQNTSASAIMPDGNGEYHMTDHSHMTEVYNGRAMLVKDGSDDQYATLLTIVLNTPFEYTGDNLRLAFIGSTDTGTRTFFAATKGVTMQDRSVARTNVYADKLSSTTIFHEALPVIGLTYNTTKRRVEGCVTDKATAQPVEGAKVSLRNGQVLYTATTGADGHYAMDVYKTNLDYDATISATGYADGHAQVHFEQADVTLNTALTSYASGIGDATVSGSDEPAATYNVDGTRTTHLQKGINIVRRRDGKVDKVLVR